MSKRQRRYSKHPLRLLAPKGKELPCDLETPVQHMLQLGPNYMRVQQPTQGPDPAAANDVSLQQSATSQSWVPVSTSPGFTSPSLLQPGHAFSSHGQSAVATYMGIYSNRGSPKAAYGDSSKLARGNEASGVNIHENIGIWTQYLPYHQGQDSWIPALHATEDAVWTAMGSQLSVAIKVSVPLTLHKMKMRACRDLSDSI